MQFIKTMKNKKSLYARRLRKIYYLSMKVGLAKKELSKEMVFISMIEKKTFIRDLKNFNEDVLDVLLIGRPRTVEEAKHLVNSHLDLESRIHNIERKYYELGKAKEIFGYGNKINRWL